MRGAAYSFLYKYTHAADMASHLYTHVCVYEVANTGCGVSPRFSVLCNHLSIQSTPYMQYMLTQIP